MAARSRACALKAWSVDRAGAARHLESGATSPIILDPTEGLVMKRSRAPRLRPLEGARIGVIWNGRFPGDRAPNQILEDLAGSSGAGVEQDGNRHLRRSWSRSSRL